MTESTMQGVDNFSITLKKLIEKVHSGKMITQKEKVKIIEFCCKTLSYIKDIEETFV